VQLQIEIHAGYLQLPSQSAQTTECPTLLGHPVVKLAGVSFHTELGMTDMSKVGGENGSRRDVTQREYSMSDFVWVGQNLIALVVTPEVN